MILGFLNHANVKIFNHMNNMRNSHYQIGFFAIIKETASAQQTQPRLLCSIAISLPLANVTSPGKLPIWLEIRRFITPRPSKTGNRIRFWEPIEQD